MRTRTLFHVLPLAALLLPLAACGGDAKSTDDAMDKAEEAADDAGAAVEHGTGMGDQDSQGTGGAKGGGEKH